MKSSVSHYQIAQFFYLVLLLAFPLKSEGKVLHSNFSIKIIRRGQLRGSFNNDARSFTHFASKCCQMNEIFDAGLNKCRKGRFSIERLTFYKFVNSSTLIPLNWTLPKVGFKHGTLEEEDCHGSGRK